MIDEGLSGHVWWFLVNIAVGFANVCGGKHRYINWLFISSYKNLNVHSLINSQPILEKKNIKQVLEYSERAYRQ